MKHHKPREFLKLAAKYIRKYTLEVIIGTNAQTTNNLQIFWNTFSKKLFLL